MAKKPTYQELEQSVKELDRIFNFSPDMIGLGNLDGYFTKINSSFRQILGYTEEELLEKPFILFVHDEDVEKTKEALAEAINGKNDIYIDSRYKCKDGSYKWIEWKVLSVVQEKKFIAVGRDITNRKHGEETLKESEERLKALSEAPFEAIFLSEKGICLDQNPAAKRMFGYTHPEAVGRHGTEWIVPEDRERVKNNMLSGYEKPYEVNALRKDGTTFPCEIQARATNCQGRPIRITALRDITERKRTEKALLDSEERYRRIFENLQDVYYETGMDGSILEISPSIEKLSLYKRKELIGKSLYDFYTDPKERDEFVKLILDKGKVNDYEIHLKDKDGSQRPCSITTLLMRDSQGAPVKLIGSIRDISERKRAEETLHKSSTRNEALLAAMPEMMFVLTKNGTYVDFKAEKKYELAIPPGEIIGKNLSDIGFSEDKVKFILEQIENTLKTGKIHIFEYELGIHGIHNFYEARIVPFGKENILATVRNITDRKWAEKEALEKEKFISSLLNAIPTPVFFKDRLGVYQGCNRAFTEIMGVTSDGIQGKTVHELWPSKHADVYHQKDLDLMENQGHQVYEFKVKDKDGKIRPVIFAKDVYKDEHGEVAGLVGAFLDITERKQVEGALRESEEKYRTIFEFSPEAIILFDKKGNVLDINSRVKDWLGYEPGDIAGKNLAEFPFLSKKSKALALEKFSQRMNGKGFPLLELEFIDKNGKKRIGLTSATPIKDEKGEIIQNLVMISDITERKQAEEEKSELEKQLRHIQKLETIGALTGGIAHDFNNILTPIMGYTEMALRKIEETDPLYKYLQYVLEGAHRAKGVIKQILLFSKQSERERQPLSLQELLKEALKLLRPSIPSTVEINQRIDANCGSVWGDATQLHQVVVNLCTNAWQAMEENGGTLSIELNQKKLDGATVKLHPNLNEKEYACLSIIDTGHGMDEKTIERIFEPFFTTKEIDKGTGLGLSVVHGIVRSHRGDILVYSEQGKGTAFHVYLPTTKAEKVASEATSKAISRGTESVMIVDDDSEIAEMVKMMLENFGYKADVYKTGLDATKAFKQQPDKYDLLISDLTMPKMTGLDLADQLHKERPELPVVIMTGFGDSLTVSTQEQYGIKQVIGKPIALRELTAVVRKLLDK